MDDLIRFLKDRFPEGIQAFSARNLFGDWLLTVYDNGGIVVDYCPFFDYIEIFGLTEEQFESLQRAGVIGETRICDWEGEGDEEGSALFCAN